MMLTSFPSFLGGGGFQPDCTAAGAEAETVSDSGATDIPADYLALYKKFGKKVGVQWNILAGVGKRETDHGRSTMPGARSGTNSAGAAGPMQFLIGTWGGKARIPVSEKVNGYASDGDGDGVADVYN